MRVSEKCGVQKQTAESTPSLSKARTKLSAAHQCSTVLRPSPRLSASAPRSFGKGFVVPPSAGLSVQSMNVSCLGSSRSAPAAASARCAPQCRASADMSAGERPSRATAAAPSSSSADSNRIYYGGNVYTPEEVRRVLVANIAPGSDGSFVMLMCDGARPCCSPHRPHSDSINPSGTFCTCTCFGAGIFRMWAWACLGFSGLRHSQLAGGLDWSQ